MECYLVKDVAVRYLNIHHLARMEIDQRDVQRFRKFSEAQPFKYVFLHSIEYVLILCSVDLSPYGIESPCRRRSFTDEHFLSGFFHQLCQRLDDFGLGCETRTFSHQIGLEHYSSFALRYGIDATEEVYRLLYRGTDLVVFDLDNTDDMFRRNPVRLGG